MITFSIIMTIRHLYHEKHAEAVNDYLVKYTDFCMFMRSNLLHSGLHFNSEPFHGDYYGAFTRSGSLCGVLAHYWNGNVMAHANDRSILKELVMHLRQVTTRTIKGILGEEQQASYVIELLGLSSSQFAVNHHEDLFSLQLDQLIRPETMSNLNSQIISAAECDTTILSQWLTSYHIEALGAEQDSVDLAETIRQEIKNTLNFNNRWVLLVDNRPVSLCGFNAQLPDCIQLGPVYTPKTHRGKHFARIAVYLCLKQAKLNGVRKAVLFTNDKAASRAYQAIGFHMIGQYRLALLK